MAANFDKLLAVSQGTDQAARKAWHALLHRFADEICEELRRQCGVDADERLPRKRDFASIAESLHSRRQQFVNTSESEFIALAVKLLRSAVFEPGTTDSPSGEAPAATTELSEDEVRLSGVIPPPPIADVARRSIDRFEIRDVLGQGGFGMVYRAYDPQLQRQVAIKIPRAEHLRDQGSQQRFLREARAAAALQHPHVCPVHDVCDSPDGFYIVMALVEGESASQRLRRLKKVPQSQAAKFVHEVAGALQVAHEAGIIHRDLKPSNIMIDRRERAVVMDFGLAVRTGTADPRLTQSGALLGTPTYMSPEQMRGETDIGPASDIYSLGVVLFELLTGRRPHTGKTAADLIARRLSTEAPRPSRYNSEIDPRLDTICLRAMAMRPQDRYASMAEFAAALEPLTPGIPATASRRSGDLVDHLPLPLARLYRRAGNAKTALERRQLSYYVWEAALKLLGSVVVVEYAVRHDRSPDLNEILQRLSRPALGHWWQIVREVVPLLAKDDPGFSEVNDFLFSKRRHDLPGAAGLYNALGDSLHKPGNLSRVRMSDLFERLIEYRNREIGHGVVGARSQEQYDRMARVLLTGIGEVLRRLDVLAGRRLLYVAEVRQSASGDWEVESFELEGREPKRLNVLRVDGGHTGALPRTQRLYLHESRLADGAPSSLPADRMLHPLIVFDAVADDVLFLNGRSGRSQAEYLSYTSGDTQRQVLAGDQRELLARVLGQNVDEQDIAAWADRSLTEEADESSAPSELLRRDEPKRIGEFELISVLGEGGMGRVYRAWQPSLGRQVALKRLNQSTDEKARARFTREIRALGRIDHPGIVKVYTSGTDVDEYFYAMELIEGADLGSVCRNLEQTTRAAEIDQTKWRTAVSSACEQARSSERRIIDDSTDDEPPVPRERFHQSATPITANAPYLASIVDIMRQMAEAAGVMHRAGIVHRDIKPGNIMVTPEGDAVLTDLGLAQLADEVDGQITRTRQFVGTLRYASPEQVLAVGKVDPRSDVYSLGATMWELLTLQPLFGATDATPSPDLMRLIQQKEPDGVRRFNESVPKDLEAVVLKCLEKDPDKRYQSACELAEDLGRWEQGKPVQARKRTAGYLLLKSMRRHRFALRIASAVAGLLLIVAAICWLGFVRPSHTYWVNNRSRFRIPEGIGELSLEQLGHRNRAYRLTHRGWWGPVVEVAVVNGSAREVTGISPIIGDEFDETLQVARIEIEYDDAGRILREIGYDHLGKFEWQAAYDHGDAYDHGGSKSCVARFLNARRHLIPLGESLATSVEMTFDSDGFETEFRYTGALGEAQPNSDGSFGARFERDLQGLVSAWTWLNRNGDAGANRNHITRAEISYQQHEIASVRYFRKADAETLADDDWVAARHRDGYSGWVNEFDAFGNVSRYVFVDGDGNPVRSNFGYAGIAMEYDEHGNTIQTSFLDLDEQGRVEDEPILVEAPQHGYAGWNSTFDDRGREIRRMFFNRHGTPTISTDEGISGWSSIYDDDGNEIIRIFLGTDGRPKRHNDGTAGWSAVYDERGNQTALRYLDLCVELISLNESSQDGSDVSSFDLSDHLAADVNGLAGYNDQVDPLTNLVLARDYIGPDGMPTRHSDGENGWRRTYDERGNIIRERYVDNSGSSVTVRGGAAGYRQAFNDLGQRVEYSHRDVNDDLILDQDGVAGWKSTYDSYGNESSRTYFGTGPGEIPKLHVNAYAGWLSTFDQRGNEIQRVFFGENGERVASREHIGGWKSAFDDRGNELQRTYLGTDPTDDTPVLHQDGSFGWQRKYDEHDRLIQFAYLDRDGSYLMLSEGFAAYMSTRDDRGLEAERRYSDDSLQPVRQTLGYHGWQSQFDERGNETQRVYIDESGVPVLTRDEGIAGWRAIYNQWNLETERAYFDTSGRIAAHSQGNCYWIRHYDVWGRQEAQEFLDANRNLISMQRNTYHRTGNWLTQTYFDQDRNPTEVNGYHTWGSDYDDSGHEIRQYYLDIGGELTVRLGTNVAGIDAQYDENGRLKRVMHFGIDEHPVLQPDGTAGWEVTYDDFGNRLTYTVLDTDGDRLVHPSYGYAWFETTFDDRHREMERVYFDADNSPVDTQIVVLSVIPGLQSEQAGILPGDVLLSYNGIEGNSVQLGYERMKLLEQDARPERVEVKLLRDGAELTVEVVPGWLGLEWEDVAAGILKPNDTDAAATEAEPPLDPD